MNQRPKVVAFDVVETLFPLGPIRPKFQALGLPPGALEIWFAQLLRNAFALDVSGIYKPFGEVARSTLEVLVARWDRREAFSAIGETLSALSELPSREEARPAFEMLRQGGVRIFALTNGSADTTKKLFQRSGLADLVERIISIDEMRRWKPAREVYLHAAKVAGVSPERLALAAAHAWDVHGASQAGLVTGWVSYLERHLDPAMNPPDVVGDTLVEVVRQLLALPLKAECAAPPDLKPV